MKPQSKRKEILEAINCYIDEHGYPPSYEEIGKAVGLASKSSINGHMKKLFSEGLLETDSNERSARAYRIPGKQKKMLERKEAVKEFADVLKSKYAMQYAAQSKFNRLIDEAMNEFLEGENENV